MKKCYSFGGVVLNMSHQVVGVIRCGPVTFKDKEKESDSSAVHGFIPIDDIINDLNA